MSETNQAQSTEPTVMKLHDLRPAPGSKTARTRVGRGEASKGKTAGRGTKGTKARYQVPAGFEGGQIPLHMRLPKLRGFTNPFRVEYQVVNLATLQELFPEGGTVTVEELVAKGAVRKNQPVKVLGSGEVSVKLDVTAQKFSASAEQKIAAAGGSVTTACVSFDGAPRRRILCDAVPRRRIPWSHRGRSDGRADPAAPGRAMTPWAPSPDLQEGNR